MTQDGDPKRKPGDPAGRFKAVAAALGGAAAVLGVIAVALGYGVYGLFRIDVPPEHVAVLVKRTGDDLPNSQVLAASPKQKGVQLEVLTEGRYFYNPYHWDWKIVPMQVVPQGQVGVVVRLFGDDPATGRILAEQESSKGILPAELKPGRYPEFSNPYAYRVEKHEAATVPPGYRGVVTVAAGGKTPTNPNALVVATGEHGVQSESIPEGTYYVNPYHRRISLVDCRQKTLSLNEDQDMGFPSKDGFWVQLDGFVRFRVNEKKAAEVFVVYNEDFNGDDVTEEIRDKVILPQARSFCRLAGSNYTGRDLVDGKTREQFQKAFAQKLTTVCEPLGVEIEAASITEVHPPKPIVEQLNRREIARQQRDQYLREIDQQKSQAKLAIQKMLKEQQGKLILAEQEVIQMKTKAEQEKQIAVVKAGEKLAVAEQRLKAAKDQSEAIAAKGKAEAQVLAAKNEAEAAGLRTAVQAFKGDGALYAQRTLFEKLAPRYHSLTVNSADSPLMKMFEPIRPGSTASAPISDQKKTADASAAVAEQKGGRQ
jgi:regulator of protease activity HflC (stomatin/prohibitin superfamily)